MERIIAGQFKTKDRADKAAAMLGQYVDTADICIFHNNPPGQHDAFPVGGDEDEDPGAEGAAGNAAGGAVAGGLAAGAVGAIGGPVVAIAAAAAGAYAGSLGGAMHGMDGEGTPSTPERRPAGVILSVRIADASNEARVIATLRTQGATGIEQAHGAWSNGDWTDFDPVAAPQLVDSSQQPA